MEVVLFSFKEIIEIQFFRAKGELVSVLWVLLNLADHRRYLLGGAERSRPRTCRPKVGHKFPAKPVYSPTAKLIHNSEALTLNT